MRIKATIITCLKGSIVVWKQILLVYCIFPIILSLGLGYFQKDSFKPKAEIDKINITIVDKDNSNSSHAFQQLFKIDDMKKLFNVTKDGDYCLTIPKGYENNLVNFKNVTITVDEKERISRDNEIIIKNIIDQYGKSLTENLIIGNKIEKLNIADKENLYNNVVQQINNFSKENSLKTNIINSKRTLSSYENQASSLITFMIITMVMSCIASYYLEKENGTFKRLMSTPIKKESLFNLELICFFIYSFIFGSIYILTFAVSGLAFRNVNPLYMFSVLIGQSLVVTTLSGIVITFLNKKSSNLVMIIILYFEILFGGAFIPLKEVSNKVFMILSKFAPCNVISEAYKNCILFNSFNSLWINLIIMLVISVFMYTVSIMKVKFNWEEE